jgi:hypothetical protein
MGRGQEQDPRGSSRSGSGDDSLVGMWLLDQYKVLRELGRGGMAQVYLAEQPSMGRLAAIKIVRPVAEGTADRQRRLREEARTASRLQHPNIVSVYNFGEMSDGSLFLAMEYLEGASLKNVLEKQGALPVLRAAVIARDCAAALDHAHGRRVIHRDFKPDNVILLEESVHDVVKVLDFGLALTHESLERRTDTPAGAILGTPRYMSPEQCRGEIATGQSDQYSLGLVLYEMLAGHPAIHADTPLEFLHAHQHQTPTPPTRSRREPEVALLDAIVLKMLAKDPAERYPAMAHVLAHLAVAIERLRLEQASGVALSLEAGGRLEPPPEAPGPTLRVRVSGADPLGQDTRSALAAQGFDLGADGPGPAPDLVVAGLPGRGWAEAAASRLEGTTAERTLVCIDARLESEGLVAAATRFQHLVIGSFPLAAKPLSLALSFIHSGRGGIEALLPHHPVRLFRLSSSTHKHAGIDALLGDARAEGLSGRTLQSLAELGEEMILNAIFHAPVEPGGGQRYEGISPVSSIQLRPGEEPLLQWSFLDPFVAISVRDRFGSLAPEEVLARITGAGGPPKIASAQPGTGMGLRIMSRAAQHLLFMINPGMSCEIIALVPHRAGSAARRSLCILQNLGQTLCEVGERLTLTEHEEGDAFHLALRGEIDETSDLRRVFHRSGRVHLDLAGISRINSIGIRAWLDGLRARSPDLDLVLESCSLAVMNQINMLPALVEGLRVVSLYAPYVCEICERDVLVWLRVEEDLSGPLPPARHCPSCGEELHFDGIRDEFFAFMGG